MNLLHSCKKAAELITQAEDAPLGTLDKIRLKLHLSMCGNCSNVKDQITQIGKMMRSTYEEETVMPKAKRPNGNSRKKG
jgi:predicted anti-sigma-YlaC factor YlaD